LFFQYSDSRYSSRYNVLSAKISSLIVNFYYNVTDDIFRQQIILILYTLLSFFIFSYLLFFPIIYRKYIISENPVSDCLSKILIIIENVLSAKIPSLIVLFHYDNSRIVTENDSLRKKQKKLLQFCLI